MEVDFFERSPPNPSEECPIVIDSSIIEPEVETVQVSGQQEDKVPECNVLSQVIQTPEVFEKPLTLNLHISADSNNSTVIIDSPLWPEIPEPTVPAPKIPTYMLPTKSHQAKRRSERISQSLVKQVSKPKAVPQNLKSGIPFSLATTMRLQGNIMPDRFLTKPAPVKRTMNPKGPTHPRSPALATKYRKRQARPIEDDPPQFKALPLNKKILQPNSCQGVPRVKAQPTTVAKSPKFSKLNRSKPQIDKGAAITQTEGACSSTSLLTARQPKATRVRSTKPTTIPRSPKFQTNARFGRPSTRLSQRSKLVN